MASRRQEGPLSNGSGEADFDGASGSNFLWGIQIKEGTKRGIALAAGFTALGLALAAVLG